MNFSLSKLLELHSTHGEHSVALDDSDVMVHELGEARRQRLKQRSSSLVPGAYTRPLFSST
jgi:hypothetical protein